MTISNYPGGFNPQVLIRGVPVAPAHSAKVFFVGNNTTLMTGEKSASNGNQGGFLDPFSTVTYALTKCSASNGDFIYVRPGYTETLTGTGDTNINVAGVTIVGLGNGANRPTITIGTSATATYTVSAANVSIVNFLFISALDGLNTALTVSGADVYLDIEHRDTSATVEADIAITVTGARPYIKLRDIGFTGGDQRDASISMNGVANGRIDIDAYGKAGTAVVNFVTAACTDINVKGYMYVSGTTDGSKNVVDTIGGSTWYMDVIDGAAGSRYTGGSAAAVASDDISAINAKVGTITNTGGTATIGAVLGDFANTTLVSKLDVPSADGTGNVDVADVVGNKTDASVYVPGTTKSLAAYHKGTADLQERVAKKAAATMTNGQTLFTIAGGPIIVLGLVSICETANDATASTLQYSATPTLGSAQTISAASASLANAAAGASVSLIGTALTTAANFNANGPNLGMTNMGGIMVPAGTITAVIGIGSTTGTWAHYIRYKPLATGVTVS